MFFFECFLFFPRASRLFHHGRGHNHGALFVVFGRGICCGSRGRSGLLQDFGLFFYIRRSCLQGFMQGFWCGKALCVSFDKIIAIFFKEVAVIPDKPFDKHISRNLLKITGFESGKILLPDASLGCHFLQSYIFFASPLL
mgnify:CR=1 FL=1